MTVYSRIAGTGSYLPEKILTNADLEKMVETSDQWIRERTGIQQRHIAAEGQTTVDLAEQAARRAMEAAGVTADQLDLIVLGTTTPELGLPAAGPARRQRLPGLRRQRRLLGLHLRPHHCRQVHPQRCGEDRAGGGGRDADPHARLERPQHLRAVR